MQKNRYLKVKSVRALVLALLFTAALFLMVPQQAMAEGGSATVTLGNAEGLSPGTSFEFELYKVLPKDHWTLWNLQIIAHGRAVCTARSPKCEECFLKDLCNKK